MTIVPDTKLLQDLAAQLSAYTALRAFFLAESYRTASKWAEAYRLFDRAAGCVRDNDRCFNNGNNASLLYAHVH